MLKRMERLFRVDHLLIVRSILGRKISRPNLRIRFSEGAISGQPSNHLIEIHIAALEVLHPCIAGQIVHERREAFLALPQCIFAPLALGVLRLQRHVGSLEFLNCFMQDIARVPERFCFALLRRNQPRDKKR